MAAVAVPAAVALAAVGLAAGGSAAAGPSAAGPSAAGSSAARSVQPALRVRCVSACDLASDDVGVDVVCDDRFLVASLYSWDGGSEPLVHDVEKLLIYARSGTGCNGTPCPLFLALH